MSRNARLDAAALAARSPALWVLLQGHKLKGPYGEDEEQMARAIIDVELAAGRPVRLLRTTEDYQAMPMLTFEQFDVAEPVDKDDTPTIASIYDRYQGDRAY